MMWMTSPYEFNGKDFKWPAEERVYKVVLEDTKNRRRAGFIVMLSKVYVKKGIQKPENVSTTNLSIKLTIKNAARTLCYVPPEANDLWAWKDGYRINVSLKQ